MGGDREGRHDAPTQRSGLRPEAPEWWPAPADLAAAAASNSIRQRPSTDSGLGLPPLRGGHVSDSQVAGTGGAGGACNPVNQCVCGAAGPGAAVGVPSHSNNVDANLFYPPPHGGHNCAPVPMLWAAATKTVSAERARTDASVGHVAYDDLGGEARCPDGHWVCPDGRRAARYRGTSGARYVYQCRVCLRCFDQVKPRAVGSREDRKVQWRDDLSRPGPGASGGGSGDATPPTAQVAP